MDTSGKKFIYYLLITLTLLFLVILFIRFSTLMLPFGDTEIHQRLETSRVQRGTIYDRNGTILAYEIPYYSCAVMLMEIDSRTETAEHLSKILSMTKEEILQSFEKKTTYALVKQRLTDAEHGTLQKAIATGEITGITIEKRYGRVYPLKEHASQIIGFTNIDNVGLDGIEYMFDRDLSPLPDPNEDISFGKDLYLTIDHRIQYAADIQSARIMEEYSPDSVMILILDAYDADILASSSLPSYDPGSFQDSTESQRRNRPVSMMYEPGSVFKVFSLASILAIGDAKTDELFLCDGSYTFMMDNGRTSTINCLSPHGEVGPEEMLTYSCNGAISYYALQTDDQQFYSYLRRFGFSEPTGITLPGESTGMLQSPENWSGRSKPTISFGQEIGVTALQLAAAATVFTNEGKLLAPHIIHGIYDPDTQEMKETEREVVRDVLPAETAREVLKMMVSATEPGGTALHAGREGLEVSAKTGTAQILDIDTNSYSDDHVLASTLAVFPSDDPQYIVYIAADNPQGRITYGSAVAAPAVSRIIDQLVAMGLLETDQTQYRILGSD